MRAATAAATAAAAKTSKKLIHFNLHVNFDTSRLEEALIAHSLQQAVGVAIVFGSSVPVAMVSPDTAEYCWLLAVPVRFCLARHYTRRHKHAAWTAS
ncbi:hypothetical protein ACFV47_19455 [Streptomyces solisilvae]|uniref:hypothetical protein n=1 Tax=Streptomyces malaysiensis TaxID=92644 RepID=UPI0036B24C8C